MKVHKSEVSESADRATISDYTHDPRIDMVMKKIAALERYLGICVYPQPEIEYRNSLTGYNRVDGKKEDGL